METDEDWHDVIVGAGATLNTKGHVLRVCGTLRVYAGLFNPGTITDAFSNGELQKTADPVQVRVNPRHLVKRLCVDGAFQASAPEAPSEYLCS